MKLEKINSNEQASSDKGSAGDHETDGLKALLTKMGKKNVSKMKLQRPKYNKGAKDNLNMARIFRWS
ncbi:hypothetical protein TNCT_630021 [Trichonephila clavata]|uniref:Uncharacterized protein n=1 Tax=Trichonephila clavata TaxID=2740835 RepID=A0A8X6FXY0_TRICU|nr:hypothetical protein TNCT_630021 [Trichonephila clavata]